MMMSKKLFLFLAPIVLLAAACNNSAQTPVQNPAVNQQAEVKTDTQSKALPDGGSQIAVGDYLTIKEWGVQFTKPADMADLQYAFSQYGTDGDSVSFTTQQLIKLDKSTGGKDCVAGQSPLGLLFRSSTYIDYTKNHQYQPGYTKVNGYYYYFVPPQATCSDNKDVQALETQQKNDLSSVILASLRAAQ